MASYWNYIFNYIGQADSIYFAVGCAMPQYRFSDDVKSSYMFDVTEKNNQQYPCFMNKFVGKKLVILLDNELEFTKNDFKDEDNDGDRANAEVDRDLVIQQYFKIIEQPLEIIVKTKTLRVLGNINTIVIAAKASFYYEEADYMSKTEIKYFRENFTTFNTMINQCVDTRKKLIVQDYTGRNLTSVYLKFLDMYGRKILNNIIFDVTQNNGGCFIELKPSYAAMDKTGNFIQEKYLKLVDCVHLESYSQLYKSRLALFNYPLSWSIFKLREDENYSEFNFENLSLLFIIYECKYNHMFKQESLSTLIKKMLDDMLTSRGLDISLGDSIITNIMNRNEFNKQVRAIL